MPDPRARQAPPHEPPDDLAVRSSALLAGRWSIVEKWGARTLTLVTLALLARLLTPRELGVATAALVLVGLFEAIADQAVPPMIIRQRSIDSRTIATAIAISASLTLVPAIALVLSAPLIAGLFGLPSLSSLIRLMALGFCFHGAASVPQALLQRALDFRALAIRRLAACAVASITAVVAAALGAGAHAIATHYVVTSFVSALVVISATRPLPRPRFVHGQVLPLLSFGTPVLGMALLAFSATRADDLLIGLFLGPTALGYYTVAFRGVLFLTESFTATVSSVALPVFSKLQDDRIRLKRAYLRALRITTATAVPIFALLAVVSPTLIPAVFGPQWRPSVPVAQLLALVGIAHAITYFDRPLLLALDRAGLEFSVSAAATATDLLGFFIAARFGIAWVAFGLALRNLLFVPVRALILRNATPIDLSSFYRAILPGCSAALVGMIGAGSCIHLLPPSAVSAVAASALGAFSAAFTLRALFRTAFLDLGATITSVFGRIAPSASHA